MQRSIQIPHFILAYPFLRKHLNDKNKTACYVLGSMPNRLHTVAYLVFMISIWGGYYYYIYFIDKETMVQSCVICQNHTVCKRQGCDSNLGYITIEVKLL